MSRHTDEFIFSVHQKKRYGGRYQIDAIKRRFSGGRIEILIRMKGKPWRCRDWQRTIKLPESKARELSKAIDAAIEIGERDQ